MIYFKWLQIFIYQTLIRLSTQFFQVSKAIKEILIDFRKPRLPSSDSQKNECL